VRLLRIIYRIPAVILYLVSYIFPRSGNIWVIGNRFGYSYNNNARHLYEYVVKLNDANIKIVWITKDRKIFNYLHKRKYPVSMAWSIPGIYYSLRSKISIVTYARYDVNSILSNGTIWIQLFHSIIIKNNVPIDYEFKYSPFKYNLHKYDYMITTSEDQVFKKQFMRLYDIPRENYFVTGYPRNDIFYKNVNYKDKNLIIDKHKSHKIILYVPTFRSGYYEKEYDLFYDNGWDYNTINSYLEINNYYLFIKLHPHHRLNNKFKNEVSTTENSKILFLNDDDIFSDVQDLLKFADIMITDYSGIFIDFLLLRRPIVFAPFDIHYYEQEPGIAYNYDSVTPGYKIYSWLDLTAVLDKINCGEFIPDDKYMHILNQFHKYQDGDSSKRVYERILSIP
jgi:CDP-glycerol glycerophosphotransferase (TagB/SpsB family)